MSSTSESPAVTAALAPEGATSGLAHALELGFELAVTPTALMTALGVYGRVNAAYAALLGRETSWFPGRSFLEVTHPDDRVRDTSFLDRLFAPDTTQVGVQKRYLREDGSVVFARVSVSVLERTADGRPSLLMTEVADHTALHGALDALRASEERLNFAMEATNDGLWDWDFATGELSVNNNWSRMLGYEPGELVPHISTWETLSHPDDVPLAYANLDAHVRGEVAQVDFEMRMQRKDGSWCWILNRAKVVGRNPDGSPRRIVGTHTDITARRAQAQATRQQAALLDSVLSNIAIVIAILGQSGRIEYINAHFHRLLGWTLEEMQHTDVFSLMYPDPDYRARVAAAVSEGGSQWRDWTARTRDGHEITISWNNVPLPDGRIVGIGTDVTATRAAEAAEERHSEQMQQAQKLESLGLLAGGIAHDFNNLLVGVLGNASLAEEILTPDSDAAFLVGEVRAAATRAAELTRQLLAYAGRGRFVVEPVDLSLLVGEMSALLRAAMSKDAALRSELAPELPAVEADATQLRQVVMNLITNASDALGDAPGTVSLRTSVREPAESERHAVVGGTTLAPGRYACVEVSDTGAGMDDSTLARIFDPFFTTKSTGHGLGLAATLGIIRSHKGGIAIRSTVGRGTTVCVYLPTIERTARMSPTPTPGSMRAIRGDGHILLADDEAAVRRVAAMSLERAGFIVTQCRDGAEAVQVFQADPGKWRAVVLDLTMPNLGGQDALLAMRAIRDDVPAVLCSGYASEELSVKVTSLDAVIFVQKPFTAARLTAALFEVAPSN